MSDQKNYNEIIELMKQRGVSFEKGLSEREVIKAEEFFQIIFPPDLKDFLMCGLSVHEKNEQLHFLFPNWRSRKIKDIDYIRDKLIQPKEGVIFDIEYNNFWYKKWGEKPDTIEEAVSICKKEFEKIPQLIPVIGHRYISSIPYREGNPIYSVWQTDIIYYGTNLKHFLTQKEGDPSLLKIDISFWSDIVG